MSTSLSTTSIGRLIGLVAAVAMIFALAPAAPAAADSASPLAAVVTGTANLSGGINACGASGTFSGTAHAGVHGTSPIVQGTASASFTYCNTLVAGDADGTITIDGHSCNFSWQRGGTFAIILFSGPGCTGGGAAAFAPQPGNPNGALVAGAGAAI